MSPPRSIAWRTGQRKTWTGHRVSSLRRVHKIEGYRLASNTGGEWLTMSEAATKFGVTNHKIRRVVEAELLPTEQIMPGASHQIRAADLDERAVKAAISRKGPCRVTDQDEKSLFPAIQGDLILIAASRSLAAQGSVRLELI